MASETQKKPCRLCSNLKKQIKKHKKQPFVQGSYTEASLKFTLTSQCILLSLLKIYLVNEVTATLEKYFKTNNVVFLLDFIPLADLS